MKRAWAMMNGLGLGLLLVAAAGCGTAKTPATDEKRETTAAVAMEVAMPEREALDRFGVENGEKLLEAFQTGDFQLLKSAALSREAEQFTATDFQAAREQMKKMFGLVTGYSYLTALQEPPFRVLLWKVEFTKTGDDEKNGKIITREMIFRVRIGKFGSLYKVCGFRF